MIQKYIVANLVTEITVVQTSGKEKLTICKQSKNTFAIHQNS